ncbi:MAG: hypothetical protein Q8Q42_03790 [Nanoarchaeota archaeon]|nr:hypothetical protein [Nanoarchaeota archaeon]
MKRPWWAYWISFVVFLSFIVLAKFIGVSDYINDSIFMLVLLTILMLMYHSFRLKPWIYLSITFAFILHNMGVFGFYNISPILIQWDHVTHFVGIAVATVIIYNYFEESGFLRNKNERFVMLLFIFLAASGVGVLVEFIEFMGYLYYGDGLGVFGHGVGDINTEWIDSEWFNTIFDLFYNSLGSLVAIIFLRLGLKRNN